MTTNTITISLPNTFVWNVMAKSHGLAWVGGLTSLDGFTVDITVATNSEEYDLVVSFLNWAITAPSSALTSDLFRLARVRARCAGALIKLRR